MEAEKLKEKIRTLEDELEQLKESISTHGKKTRFVAGFRRLNQFFSSYQALFTFILAILTLVYVQTAYNIDPLESYRSTSTTKKLSEFYRELGDKLVSKAEFTDAESAYKSALSLQPNNIRATYGLAKTQVFARAEGQKYTDKGLVEIKLDYLLSHFPDDADIYFLKCLNAEATDNAEAKSWCEEAIRRNDKADAMYVELGYICQKELDLECAVTNYKKALELNPQSQLANNNIGYSELLRLNVQDSVKYLERAYTISPRLVTLMNLGEAYRYLGDIEKAVSLHKAGVDITNEEGIEKERIVCCEWVVNYLPRDKNDGETIKQFVLVSTMNDKKAMLHYALSIDYALQGDFKSASKEFEEGLRNDKGNQYGAYFMNRCLSATRILDVSPNTKSWFRKYIKRICPDKELCSRVDMLYR